jgi:23S rRNA (cytidine1920-2'-O)/16S rRNA (cytidine1409-2'-O)-methyltransferase
MYQSIMKKRLDILMVERGLAATRTQAQALIMAGQVSAEGRRLEKPGMTVDEGVELHVKDQPRYVSRAGDKLASVTGALGLEFDGRVVLDVGSSTGGFTDYALQHGAVRVYCVDVGTAQLSYKLRQDPRVVVMEQTDIRDVSVGEGSDGKLGAKAMPDQVDMAVMDVSFISLTKVLEVTAALVKPGGLIVAMVKPQFEAGKLVADKYRGVIPVGPVRDEILDGLREWVSERFEIVAEADSGVAGAEGNVERFLVLRRG